MENSCSFYLNHSQRKIGEYKISPGNLRRQNQVTWENISVIKIVIASRITIFWVAVIFTFKLYSCLSPEHLQLSVLILNITFNLYSISLLVLFFCKGYWLVDNWNYDHITMRQSLTSVRFSHWKEEKREKFMFDSVNAVTGKYKGSTLMTTGISGSFPFNSKVFPVGRQRHRDGQWKVQCLQLACHTILYSKRPRSSTLSKYLACSLWAVPKLKWKFSKWRESF